VSKIVSPNAPVALKVENLRKSFGANEVLKGISLEAREGEVISILGSSCAASIFWKFQRRAL